MSDPRHLIVDIARLMYERFLTNAAGGNVSCRIGDRVFMTPKYAGSKRQWHLDEDAILVLDESGRCIEGDADRISRESKVHLACYQSFREVNGVIHAHPRYLSVYAALGLPLVPTSEYTEKFGQVEVVPRLPSHTQELADAVVSTIQPRQALLAKHGLGVVLAWHGVATVGRDLHDAYDTLERLEWMAHTLLVREMLPGRPALIGEEAGVVKRWMAADG